MHHRDAAVFPDDDNGDVLWQMHCDGDNLATPREMGIRPRTTSRTISRIYGVLRLQGTDYPLS